MACMKHIPVDVVMKYSEELLARYGGKSARELPRERGNHQCRIIAL